MAHATFVVDPDPDRRRRFAERIRAALASGGPLFEGQVAEEASCGDLTALWSTFPAAPRGSRGTADGFALLLGYALADDDRRIAADELLSPEPPSFAAGPTFPVHDGYFLAAAFRRETGCTLGVDPFGMFPLYYAVLGDVFVAATYPEFVAAHPEYRGDLDPLALAGILLMNGLTGGRALLSGIRRLRPGHVLRRSPTGAVAEVETYRLTPRDLSAERDLPAFAEDELRRALRRHRPPGESVLMMSGGLDSRLVAGCLAAESPPPSACVLGRPEDFEVRAARGVARALDLRLHVRSREAGPTEYIEMAGDLARRERLSAGFGGFDMLFGGRDLGEFAPTFRSGFALDHVLGGHGFEHAHDPRTGVFSWDTAFRNRNAWGMPAADVARLLGPAGAALVEQVLAEAAAEFAAGADDGALRSFVAMTHHRVRFQVGTALHGLSLRCWPLNAALDRRLMEIGASLPPERCIGRRLQLEMLERSFPSLTEVPLDTNSFRFEPACLRTARQGPPWWVRGWYSLKARVRRAYYERWLRIEPRRYVRRADLNSPHWRAVRRAAEPGRSPLHARFDPATLDAFWPPPDRDMRFRDGVSQGSVVRKLLGLALAEAAGLASD